MELGPKNHNGGGLLGPNSIMVVFMDPLGNKDPKVYNLNIAIIYPLCSPFRCWMKFVRSEKPRRYRWPHVSKRRILTAFYQKGFLANFWFLLL